MSQQNYFKALLADFNREGFVLELLALVGCLIAAWFVVWLLRRTLHHNNEQGADSVLFGRRGIDGILFPLISLALVYVLRVTVFSTPEYALFRVATLMLCALAAIRLIARVVALAYPDSTAGRLIERFFSWFVWLGIVLWLAGVLPIVTAELEAIQFSLGKSKVSLLGMFEGILAALLVIVLSLWVSAAIEKRLLSDAVEDLSLRKVATNAIRMLLLIVGLLFALSALGVDLTALSVLGGALGVGLGFGLQKLASNYVSGFVILLERSLRIGDNVKIDGFEGRVTDIKTRYTMIRSVNGREAIVPNEKVITERVENLSLSDPKVLVVTNITVGYDSDVAQIQKILCDSAASSDRVLKEPAPVAHLANFALDGLEFSLCFWISDPENGQLNVKSEVHIAIIAALRQANIDIPYPQRVVRMLQTP
ncbi:mechanosensitive ion channel domain-containing protein [Variovorax sp. PCZ-1]|uniref:mechanosensitive ion channel family protein n=1 Tax=Variovorax sp. PCZ-1 TaxID=2835533 RepID=UPI001BD08270|nr:mechanosensitive ion channel domain-containing protein [Variovorax sp. PCZ-1]MBS7807370.1 mechanosensitive ion channel [Variovorax sp. PCZ-1]